MTKSVMVFGTTILVYGTLYSISRFVTTRLYRRAYVLNCNRLERRHWNSLTPSVLHAIAVTACSTHLIVLSRTETTTTTSSTSGSTFLLSASLGYFFADFILLLANEAKRKKPSFSAIMMIHHVVSIAALSAALMSGMGHLNILMIMLTEATTPCIALRWILDKLNKKGTRVYLANGILLTVTWVIFRVILFVTYFRVVSVHTGTWHHLATSLSPIMPKHAIMSLWVAQYALPLPLFAMNIYWFGLILRGLVKHLRKMRR